MGVPKVGVGKTDPEKVINFKIKVRNLVTRLETMGMGEALVHDPKFLSAVYCALPDRHRVRWLDFTKSENHWESMLIFLDNAYEDEETIYYLQDIPVTRTVGNSARVLWDRRSNRVFLCFGIFIS